MLLGWGLSVPEQSGSWLIPAFSDLTREWMWQDINSQKKKWTSISSTGTWEEGKLVPSRSVCCGRANTRFLPEKAMVLAGSEFRICLRVEDGVRRSHRVREEIAQAWEDMKRRWGSECGVQNRERGRWNQWARMTECSLSPDPAVSPPLSSDLMTIAV